MKMNPQQTEKKKKGPAPGTVGKLPQEPPPPKTENQVQMEQAQAEQKAAVDLASKRLSLSDLPPDVKQGLMAMAHIGNAASLAAVDAITRKAVSRSIDQSGISVAEWQELDQALAAVLVYYSDVLAHPIAVWVSTMTMIGISHAKTIAPPTPKKLSAGGDPVPSETQVREVIPDQGSAGTEAKTAVSA